MGCGKLRGFQLVIDSQKLNSLPKSHLPKGFKVFVTIPGVVTCKVPFEGCRIFQPPTFQPRTFQPRQFQPQNFQP